MDTTTITTENEIMTLINVFTVEPEKQQELIDILTESTSAMRQFEGFISANLHRSRDGRRVVNYAQWLDAEHYEAMLADPRALPHLQRAAQISRFDPIVADVVYVGHI